MTAVIALEKIKRKHERTEAVEDLSQGLIEWRTLDRKPPRDQDWLRYAKPKKLR
jgi:hypothetical protein